MKLLLLADHEERALWDDWNNSTAQKLSDVDLILSAGDLNADYLEFLVTMLNVPLVYVRGNHDGQYDKKPPEGCVDADGRIVEMSRRIAGLRKAFFRDRLRGKSGFDILLTHAPCKGHGDMEDIAHTGFECFNQLLGKHHPKLHVYGHVHKEYGQIESTMIHESGTKLINASGHYIVEI